MSEPVQESLRRLAQKAKDRGIPSVEALCVLAAAKIDELEAEILTLTARQRLGGQARAKKLSPERRQEIARAARAKQLAASKQAKSVAAHLS